MNGLGASYLGISSIELNSEGKPPLERRLISVFPSVKGAQLSQTLIQHGLGHLTPTPSRDDDTNDEPLWVRIIKAKAKSANKAGVDAYVKYSELTPSEVDAAKMTKSSYINLTEGQHAAHAYANEHIKGWTLDTSLIDEHSAVYVSKGENQYDLG